MKKCPACSQMFEDDHIFCVSDGAPLVSDFEGSRSGIVVSLENEPPVAEIATQVVPRVTPPASIPRDNSKFLYAVIGALVAVIFAMGLGFFILSNTKEKETAQISNPAEIPTIETNSAEPDLPNQNSATNLSNTPKNKNNATPKTNQTTNMNWSGNSNTGWSENSNSSANFSLTRRFDRTFSGTADNDSITLRLQRNGSSLGGRVFSRRSATEISVSGNIDNNGYFEMSEYSDIGVVTGIYQGRLSSDGTMNGTWTKPDGSKPRPFFLRAN